MSITKTLAFAITFTLVGSTALAGNRARSPQKQKVQQKVQRMLAKFDHNGDGALDARELTTMHAFKAKKHRRMLQRFDKNGDGQLGPAEKRAARATKKKRQAKLARRFDKNRNGQLEPNERQAAKNALFHNGVSKRYDRLLKRHDANGDGALSRAELSRAMQKAQTKAPRRAAKMRKRFQAADHNADGVITRDEFARSVVQMRQERQHKRQERQQKRQERRQMRQQGGI